MQYAVLGPLEVTDDGRTIPIGGGKPRALLALLLLNDGRVVPAERLIDELWGDEPPSTAATALQVYVSKLRKALGETAISTREPGYALDLGAGSLDLTRFEALVAAAKRADAAGTAELLREALALWRGPALADVALKVETQRLEELRLSALEDRIDADLELGRAAELVPELEALVREQPLRERPRAQLMLALYRAGRQAAALEAYRDARRALVDELGIEPSPRLQELEQAILRQDPSLAPPAEQRTTATVVFLDLGIRGEVEAIGERAFAEASNELARTAVCVEPGLADAALALFDDATTAVRAAVAVRNRLRELGDAVAPRVGLATGDVLRGARTSGPAVVLAARRVREAKPGEIVAGERTAAAARESFSFRRRGEGFVLVEA
jgi:DNA-binding SARP family transcriptional activator